MAIAEQTITAERFLELVDLPEYQDSRLELVEGKLVEMSRPKRLHGVVVSRVNARIANHVEANDLGEVAGSDAGFVLERNPFGRDTVRGVDVAFVSKRHNLGQPDDAWYEVAPDLAVEVISPGNRAGDIHHKVVQLLKAGARLIWLVYPDTRSVVVHRSGGSSILYEDDMLAGGDVLPGFELGVGEIFPG